MYIQSSFVPVFLSAAFAVTAFASLGSEPEAEDSRTGRMWMSSALSADASFDSRTSGTLLSKVEVEAAYQEEFNTVVDPVIGRHSASYAEAGFTGPEAGYVAFTEPLPKEDRDAILAIRGATLIEDAALTLDEAEEAMANVSAIVASGMPEDRSSMVHIDPILGVPEIITDAPVPPKLQEAIAHVVPEPESGKDTPPNTDPKELLSAPGVSPFIVDKTLAATTESVNGGEKLTIRNTTRHECTAGFPAKKGRYAGLLTAEHCNNALTVDKGDRLYNASVFRAGKLGDAQWHRAKETVNGKFRYAWGKYRPVWAHPVLKVGTKVCRFGATTGNGSGCTTVKYTSACVKYQNRPGPTCTLSMTNTHTGSKGGDSGGPWYYGNNAYGIHSGSATRDGRSRNWFYPSRVALGNMGLTAILGTR